MAELVQANRQGGMSVAKNNSDLYNGIHLVGPKT